MNGEKLRYLINNLVMSSDIPPHAFECRSYKQVMASCAYMKPNRPVASSPYGIEQYRHYGGILKLELTMNRSYE